MSALYSEAKVAAKLGLGRETVRYIREEVLKKERGHWEHHGREIALSRPGLLALLLHVGAEKTNLDDCKFDEQKKEGAIELTVARILPNRQLLLATLPENEGELLTVRVKDNSNFRLRMKLKAFPPAPNAVGIGKFYQLACRCPRLPGRY